ncbi:MAG TPA: hypothetical protein PKN32_06130 [Bacteroidales bacterium]|nr:hypothetical protein [Bacteroidales bacterium]
MAKVLKIKKGKILYLWLFVFGFLVLSLGVYFIGKNLNKPSDNKVPLLMNQQDEFQFLIDFESYNYLNANCVFSKERALSGKHSGISDKNNPYGAAITIPIPTNDTSEIEDVIIRFWINPTSSIVDAVWVFTVIDQNNNQLYWEGFVVKGDSFAADNWYSFIHSFKLPKKFINSGLLIKTYLWNKDTKSSSLYLDDVSISLKNSNSEEGLRTKLIDFENINSKQISSKYAKSGFYSTFAKGKDGFSESIIFPLSELDISNLHSISFSFSYLSETKDMDAVFVISICDSLHKDLLWQGVDLSKASFEEKKWEIANGSVIISPEIAKNENFLKIYLWNRNDNQVYIDDVYLVIKENDSSNDSVLPAFNMIKEKKFQAKANHPPYETKYIFCNTCQEKNAGELNKLFTKNSRILVDKFDSSLSKDQIFFNSSNELGFAYIDNKNVKFIKPKFSTQPGNNAIFYSDEGYLFSSVPNGEKINMYRYDKITQEFVLKRQFEYRNSGKISYIVLNPDNSLSVFENDGNIATYNEQNVFIAKTKLFNPKTGNLKVIKTNFFNEIKEVLVIYIENSINKYVFLNYDKASKSWTKSTNYKNSSVQAYDKLDFISEYYVIKDDNSAQNKLLQFNRNLRFDLKVISFDFMTYNILYNIDFRGFAAKQNPKYYEYTKIICGDFCGDSKSEIIIFQDNINRVDWLTQKTEIYSFND